MFNQNLPETDLHPEFRDVFNDREGFRQSLIMHGEDLMMKIVDRLMLQGKPAISLKEENKNDLNMMFAGNPFNPLYSPEQLEEEEEESNHVPQTYS